MPRGSMIMKNNGIHHVSIECLCVFDYMNMQGNNAIYYEYIRCINGPCLSVLSWLNVLSMAFTCPFTYVLRFIF